MNRRELGSWLAWLALTLAVAVAWSNSLGGEFTYDDKIEVIGNRTIRLLDRWDAILSYNLSRPLVIASYAVNFDRWQFEPAGYHAVDVVLHMLNAGLALALVAGLLQLAGRQRALAGGLLAAGIWALHPMQTESVSYVTGRSEQIVAIFYLLGCWCWVRSLQAPSFWRSTPAGEGGDEPTRAGWPSFLAAHVAFALGALSKEVIFTLPGMLFLLEWIVARRGSLRAVQWARYLPLAAAIAGASVWRIQTYGALTAPEFQRPLDVQLWTEAEVVWRYLQLSVLPVGQSIFHDHPETGPTARSIAALAGLIAVTIAALWGRARGPLLSMGWLWFLLALLPATVVPLRETMAEHRVHLSLLGVAWVAAIGLEALWDRLAAGRLAQLGIAGPVAAGLAIWAILIAATLERNRIWRTEVALWGEAVERNPGSAHAWYGYGDALRFAEDCKAALDAYERARAIDPELVDAWINAGICQAVMGKAEAAERTWLDTLARFPSACKAHNNLGLLHARQGDYTRAAGDFRTALTYCPKDVRAHHWMGDLCYDHLGDNDCALAHYEYALELEPYYSYEVEIRKRILEITW